MQIPYHFTAPTLKDAVVWNSLIFDQIEYIKNVCGSGSLHSNLSEMEIMKRIDGESRHKRGKSNASSGSIPSSESDVQKHRNRSFAVKHLSIMKRSDKK